MFSSWILTIDKSQSMYLVHIHLIINIYQMWEMVFDTKIKGLLIILMLIRFYIPHIKMSCFLLLNLCVTFYWMCMHHWIFVNNFGYWISLCSVLFCTFVILLFCCCCFSRSETAVKASIYLKNKVKHVHWVNRSTFLILKAMVVVLTG